MELIWSIIYPKPETWMPADIMSALERAAVGHAEHLGVGHDRMVAEFGCLWMLVRSRFLLERLPQGDLAVTTWTRKPSAAISIRDFSLADERGVLGRATQSWVMADTAERKLVSLKAVPVFWTLPTLAPERTQTLRRLPVPELPQATVWDIRPEEIDDNGHLNNVAYVRHAQQFAPDGWRGAEVHYDRECFAGERLTLFAGDGFVLGRKSDGAESFRLKFLTGEESL